MKLSVVIIGLGQQSLNEHIPALLRRNDVRIIGACDPSEEAGNTFKQRYPELAYRIPTYSSVTTLLNRTQPTMAVIAVPHNHYYDIVAQLCQRKIYLLKEKPLARNISEAKAILSIPGFDRYGFVATQRRYSWLYQRVKETLPDIGEPYLFNAVYKLNINSPHSGWRGQLEHAGGGCLLDMGYHVIDQLLWWFGTPQKINAQVSTMAVPDGNYDAEDSATVSFQYRNGMHGILLVSRCAGEKTEQYGIYGPNGYIEGSKLKASVHDRQGHLLNQFSQETADSMFDAQLDFFISKARTGQGFTDVQAQHLENIHFIERCYDDTHRTISKNTVG